jgi:predicted DNA-binding helix-hairpin-helix protein
LKFPNQSDSNYWRQIKPSGHDQSDAFCKNELIQYKEEKKIQSTPKFAPAGQSTQVIVEQRKKTIFKSFKLLIIL